MADIVIGSGPAGVSVAQALLARGREVVMLDGGKVLEDAARARRDAIAATAPEDWTDAARDAWQAPQFDTPDGQVRRYGSDFAMEPGVTTLSDPDGFALRASRAVGGLSNLWGAAVLPYRTADLAGWPVTAEALAPHYRAVAGFMPVAGRADDLEALLPAFPMEGRRPLPPSPQAEVLLARLDAARAALAGMGVHAGAGRQAVDAECRQCGQCLHGCPWGHIWSAARTVAELRARTGFTHRPGPPAQGFAETAEGVEVTLEDGTRLAGTRLFIAAGVLETARLLLASHPGGAGRLRLRESGYFFLPALHRWRAKRRPDAPPFTTLPQAFVEIDDPSVSPHLVHAQLYTWNAFYPRDLVASYGAKLPGSAPLWRALARRLIVAQVFLHSDHYAAVDVTLAPDGRLAATVAADPGTALVANAATARLGRALGHAGLSTLGFARRPGAPGSSFHVGGSVPMASDPAPGQADRLGRPQGLGRVHLVDASVLPSIPATTITFSVMANAHRIGTEAP
ncbi:hypothetical protein DDZ14_07565 [Maritimibacter sp. 55A14]|uniref:GMC oxidoreductase n=1 Tax=Maritimibacter sp. 55A14 TaxID=2174844 RepID=UPI000D619FE2|nr:GMC oxidoreductase [Maritimibacter sp. 55A14]PWE32940.1 hypothetical protein DDZ14_07565 [Maritimibacter sp. 55A14]